MSLTWQSDVRLQFLVIWENSVTLAEALHAEVGTYAAEQNVDLVCGIGDLTRSLVEEASKGANTEALWFADNESFIQAIPDIIKDGDNVLVKASHGMNFPQIVHALEEL